VSDTITMTRAEWVEAIASATSHGYQRGRQFERHVIEAEGTDQAVRQTERDRLARHIQREYDARYQSALNTNITPCGCLKVEWVIDLIRAETL
jgi:hypothetical protein